MDTTSTMLPFLAKEHANIITTPLRLQGCYCAFFPNRITS